MTQRPIPARWTRSAALALALAMLAGCGRLRPGGGPEPARLVFANQGMDEAAVYIVAGGVDPRRIGTVMAGRTDTLTVPTDVTSTGSSVTIVARLLAHSPVSTGPVTLQAGEVYQVTLPSDERLLSFLPAP